MKKNTFTTLLLRIFVFCTAIQPAYAQEKTQQLSLSDVPTSKALPRGMQMVWNDEFNQKKLDTDKWWDKYYSSLDVVNPICRTAFEKGELPSAELQFTDNTIIIKTSNNTKYPLYPEQIEKYHPSKPTTGVPMKI